MPAAPPTVLLCGTASDVVAALARGLDGTRIVQLPRPGRVRSQAAGVEAASGRAIDAAWSAAKRIDAVVICPRGGSAARGRAPWTASLDASLKSTFFLAQHATRRLARRGGALVIAVPAAGRGDQGALVHEGLVCMVDALEKAAPRRVRVGAVVGYDGASAPGRTALARAIRALLADGGRIAPAPPRRRAARG